MLRASIEDGESDNEEYRKIRREIATSSDMTEQQLLQGPGDLESEFGKEEIKPCDSKSRCRRSKK